MGLERRLYENDESVQKDEAVEKDATVRNDLAVPTNRLAMQPVHHQRR